MTGLQDAETRFPRWLVVAFGLPVLVFFVALAVGNEVLTLATKALPVAILAGGVLITLPASRYRNLIVSGLALGAVGDLLLEMDLFELGLVAFLIGQIIYTTAFWADARSLRPLPALVFYVYGAVLVWALAEGAGDMLIPVAAYALAITTMLWRAVARIGHVPASTGVSAALGATLFVVSDSIIAVDRFGTPVPGDRWLIMITYWAAQALIAYSAMARPEKAEGNVPPAHNT